MELVRGTIFTPDKKRLLIDEIQNELNQVDNKLRKGGRNEELKEVRQSLAESLKTLTDKRGVVTPQETDDVLDLISRSKRLRLEGSYMVGMRRTTFYLVALVAIGIGVYIYKQREA